MQDREIHRWKGSDDIVRTSHQHLRATWDVDEISNVEQIHIDWNVFSAGLVEQRTAPKIPPIKLRTFALWWFTALAVITITAAAYKIATESAHFPPDFKQKCSDFILRTLHFKIPIGVSLH